MTVSEEGEKQTFSRRSIAQPVRISRRFPEKEMLTLQLRGAGLSYLAMQKEKESCHRVKKAATLDSKNKEIFITLGMPIQNKTIKGAIEQTIGHRLVLVTR